MQHVVWHQNDSVIAVADIPTVVWPLSYVNVCVRVSIVHACMCAYILCEWCVAFKFVVLFWLSLYSVSTCFHPMHLDFMTSTAMCGSGLKTSSMAFQDLKRTTSTTTSPLLALMVATRWWWYVMSLHMHSIYIIAMIVLLYLTISLWGSDWPCLASSEEMARCNILLGENSVADSVQVPVIRKSLLQQISFDCAAFCRYLQRIAAQCCSTVRAQCPCAITECANIVGLFPLLYVHGFTMQPYHL